MRDYRLYMLDEGELQWPQDVSAADDSSAIAIASRLCVEGRQMELWDRKRKVHCWGFPGCPSQCDELRAVSAAQPVAGS